ncbi:deoxyribonuclease-2-beta [Scleropages formosus]|nr:deoxyribonuclease-2-beta [Scleropages formosus]
MWLFFLYVFLCGTYCTADISCRNEAGNPVDWFIIYKLPQFKIGSVGTGLDYMYLDSSMKTWQMSKFLVNDSNGALGNTLKLLYDGKGYKSNRSAYVFYNDAPPLLKYSNRYGHTKGVLLFNESQGLWLIHSVPHFPAFPENGYAWPSSGRQNGQTVLCVTYKYQQIPSIAQQLLYYNPRVYNCSLPTAFQPDLASLVILCQGSKMPWVSDKNLEKLTSANGESFLSFAKSRFWIDDIYTGWVAQMLKVDLLTETWQRKEHELPSNCSLPKHTLNIRRIKLPGPVLFYSHFDHSKWCVSKAYESQWTCLGDLNREDSQAWKSGGLVCSQNPTIYQAFRQAVSWYIGC